MNQRTRKDRNVSSKLAAIQICIVLACYSMNSSFAQSSKESASNSLQLINELRQRQDKLELELSQSQKRVSQLERNQDVKNKPTRQEHIVNNSSTLNLKPALFSEMPAKPQEDSLDAVYAPNIRVYGGSLGVLVQSYKALYLYSGASWAFPISHAFGFQTELLAGANNKNTTLLGAGNHLFWRNPQIGALGLYAGAAHNNGVYLQDQNLTVGESVIKAGLEGSWYANSFLTLEAVGGNNWSSFDNTQNLYTDVRLLGYYRENTQLYVGYAFTDKYSSVGAGVQHQFYTFGRNAALVYLEGTVGENSTSSVNVGIRLALGGGDKTLVRHDREDYVPIQSTLLALSGASSVSGPPGPSGPPGAAGAAGQDATFPPPTESITVTL